MVSRLGIIRAPLVEDGEAHSDRRNGHGRPHRSNGNGNGNGAAAEIAELHTSGGVDMPRVEAAVREMLIGLGENPEGFQRPAQ